MSNSRDLAMDLLGAALAEPPTDVPGVRALEGKAVTAAPVLAQVALRVNVHRETRPVLLELKTPQRRWYAVVCPLQRHAMLFSRGSWLAAAARIGRQGQLEWCDEVETRTWF